MKISELTDQELASAIERLTGFRFDGEAWCVVANSIPKARHEADPDAGAIGITYWGDSNVGPSTSPDLATLCAFDAIAKGREHLVKDGVTGISSLGVFVGRAALQQILAGIIRPGGSGSKTFTPRRKQDGR